MSDQIHHLPVAIVHEDPENPRTKWGDMEAFAAEIAALGGIIEPVIVVEHPSFPGHYLIRHGARRKRGTVMAGQTTIRAIVVDAEGRATKRIEQLVDNHAQPLSPMDEGVGYARIATEDGLSVTEIAERSGVSATTIASRIQLTELIPSLRELVDVRMPIVAASLLAQHAHELQESVAEDLGRMHPSGWITVADVRRIVERYVRDLSETPFALEALGLGGLPCGRCPHNTAIQPDLFQEVGAICTRPPCWSHKTDEAWATLVAKAAETNVRVFDDAEVLKAFDGSRLRHGAPWVDADAPIAVETPETWTERERALAKSSADGLGFDLAQTAYARAGDRFYRLVSAPYVAGFIVQEYPETARRLRGEKDPAVIESQEEREAKRAKAAVELEARSRGIARFREWMDGRELDLETATKLARLTLLMVIDAVPLATRAEVAKRLKLSLRDEHEHEISPTKALDRASVDMDPKALSTLTLDLLTVRTLTAEDNLGKVADELLGLAGVSMKKLVKDISNEARGVKVKKPRKSLPVVVDGPAAETGAAE